MIGTAAVGVVGTVRMPTLVPMRVPMRVVIPRGERVVMRCVVWVRVVMRVGVVMMGRMCVLMGVLAFVRIAVTVPVRQPQRRTPAVDVRAQLGVEAQVQHGGELEAQQPQGDAGER